MIRHYTAVDHIRIIIRIKLGVHYRDDDDGDGDREKSINREHSLLPRTTTAAAAVAARLLFLITETGKVADSPFLHHQPAARMDH